MSSLLKQGYPHYHVSAADATTQSSKTREERKGWLPIERAGKHLCLKTIRSRVYLCWKDFGHDPETHKRHWPIWIVIYDCNNDYNDYNELQSSTIKHH